ncbi:hypothetical protein BHE74_00016040 [Ensete ventricosum]|nr:hypothetical protein BHE74_00016040 [Ensete ventricosum]
MLTGRWREEEVDLAGSMRDREQVHQAERKVTDIKVDRCAAREGERRKQRPINYDNVSGAGGYHWFCDPFSFVHIAMCVEEEGDMGGL